MSVMDAVAVLISVLISIPSLIKSTNTKVTSPNSPELTTSKSKKNAITASSATGIVTYYVDASYLTGVSTSFSAAIGIQSGGTTIGAAITTVNFVGGSSTVTVQGTTGTIHLPTAGISIGLAIALGG